MAERRPAPFIVVSVLLHVAALAIAIVSPRRWHLALAAVIANHIGIVIACLLPRSALFGRNVRRLPSRDAVAITFDDGPDPAITPAVLDVLEKFGAKATFFCIGRKAEAHPELIAAIRAGGHDVENHSYGHPNLFALFSPENMLREIVAAQDAIERTAAVRPRFFRTPAGFQNPWLFPVMKRAGVTLISWTRRGFDTVTTDPDRVAARLTRNLRAGDILVLHDRVPVVLEALPRVLEEIQKKGLRTATLSEVVNDER
jgi:peptidoglycan/xylan/chitin deacetylase (PgdA/CDA1 family)